MQERRAGEFKRLKSAADARKAKEKEEREREEERLLRGEEGNMEVEETIEGKGGAKRRNRR